MSISFFIFFYLFFSQVIQQELKQQDREQGRIVRFFFEEQEDANQQVAITGEQLFGLGTGSWTEPAGPGRETQNNCSGLSWAGVKKIPDLKKAR